MAHFRSMLGLSFRCFNSSRVAAFGGSYRCASYPIISISFRKNLECKNLDKDKDFDASLPSFFFEKSSNGWNSLEISAEF